MTEGSGELQFEADGMRIIMLIDMDYFYVACEELRNSEVRDRPTIVGSDPKGGNGRGVVMTCNYKAREFGIRSGMPISIAFRIKPDALYLPLDYDFYESISKRIMEVIRGFSRKFEQVSVDEAFIDASDVVSGYDDALTYARKMQDDILNKTGIKCSVGIGPNKLIAKMACEKAKPNGIKAVKEAEVRQFLSEARIDDLYGIGAKTVERLKKLGYDTVDGLANANSMEMVAEFGALGTEIKGYANGIDNREVTENYEVKSIGREFTFEKDTDSAQEIEGALKKLAAEVMKEVDKSNIAFKTITIKLRYYDFAEHLHTRSVKSTRNPEMLSGTAIELYRDNAERKKKIRKIGVRVSNLTSYKGQRRIG